MVMACVVATVLVYKKYLTCHKFIQVSKGQLLNQNTLLIQAV